MVSPTVSIYLDFVFLINFTMDFVILWAAAKLGRLKTNLKLLVLGSLIGTAYALMFFLPALSYVNTFLAKIFCSLIMVLITYRPTTMRGFIKSCGYFYLISFLMGGAVLASLHFFSVQPLIIETWNGVLVNTVNFKSIWLMAGLVVALVIGLWSASYIRHDLEQGPWLVKVVLKINNKKIATEALVDTGNQLIDPITKEPVLVIEHQSLSSILPEELMKVFNQRELPALDELLDLLGSSEWLTRLRLIPFTSLGNPHGMLIGIKPDEILIHDGPKTHTNKKAILGIYHLRLCSKGTYHALVHPGMLEN